jgi:hypothetical protein
VLGNEVGNWKDEKYYNKIYLSFHKILKWLKMEVVWTCW